MRVCRYLEGVEGRVERGTERAARRAARSALVWFVEVASASASALTSASGSVGGFLIVPFVS
jgi:hypothetical protein